MSKRIISKAAISVLFAAFTVAMCFAGGGFSTIRNGFFNALQYDFEVSDILHEMGVDINDKTEEEHFVGGEAVVEFYCMPVNGVLKEELKDRSVYQCDLILTVVAPAVGYVSDIVQNKEGYSVTVKNSQRYEITVDNLQNIYVEFGQNVSAGQIIGCLNIDGETSVKVVKDGVNCNASDFFD